MHAQPRHLQRSRTSSLCCALLDSDSLFFTTVCVRSDASAAEMRSSDMHQGLSSDPLS